MGRERWRGWDNIDPGQTLDGDCGGLSLIAQVAQTLNRWFLMFRIDTYVWTGKGNLCILYRVVLYHWMILSHTLDHDPRVKQKLQVFCQD